MFIPRKVLFTSRDIYKNYTTHDISAILNSIVLANFISNALNKRLKSGAVIITNGKIIVPYFRNVKHIFAHREIKTTEYSYLFLSRFKQRWTFKF